MPAERRLKGVAVEFGLEDNQAALGPPIPPVVPVARALLVRRAAARPHWPRRLGDLAARREDGVTLFLGDRRRGLLVRAAATTQEEREAGGAGHVAHPSPGQAAALGPAVKARLAAQRPPA